MSAASRERERQRQRAAKIESKDDVRVERCRYYDKTRDLPKQESGPTYETMPRWEPMNSAAGLAGAIATLSLLSSVKGKRI